MERPERGEDSGSRAVETADHWVAVFGELATFKRDLLCEIDRQAGATGHDDSPERRAVVHDLRRFQKHLDYWRGRRDQLREGRDRP